jgi:hypothetical protein
VAKAVCLDGWDCLDSRASGFVGMGEQTGRVDYQIAEIINKWSDFFSTLY